MPRVAGGDEVTTVPKKKGRPVARNPAAGGHKLPPPLPDGIILQDTVKKKWKLGKPIGQGGFGQLYLASDNVVNSVPSTASFVIKIEPHSNGPLFSELHFYQRAAKPDYIEKWKSEHKLKHIGVPKYISSGLHEEAKVRYRFMVMERFGQDLAKIFEENGKKFQDHSVYKLAICILDVFEYIHAKEYTHADVKGSNILLGYTNKQVYLVDYGLAYRYSPEGVHKPFKEDPKKAHDGTVEFTSIDAHNGVTPSRRSDLEILGYVLLQWLCSVLPWEDRLADKNYVKAQKIKYMSDIPALMEKCLPGRNYPVIAQYLKYTQNLKYDEKPDYMKLRQLFTSELKKLGVKDTSEIDLTAPTEHSPSNKSRDRAKRPLRSTISSEENIPDNVLQVTKSRKKLPSAAGKKAVCKGKINRPPRRKKVPTPTPPSPSPTNSSSSSSSASDRKTNRTKPNAQCRNVGKLSAVLRSPAQMSSVATQTSPWLRKAYLKEGH